ncbi:MAG: energy-coupling factor transporter transmembrane component T [Anaerolineae bacterium]|jgi:energy-coupling factor transport system permease protein
MFHTLTWVLWLVAAVVPAFIMRNPLYLALLLGATWLLYTTLGRTTPMGSSWGSFVKLGVFLFALAIPFNALSIHIGQIVLFHLPESWPIIGGPITLEAVIAGAVSGLALLTILVVFAAFNAVVDHYQLLRATPSFLFQAGVVISIAITFVPQMVISAREIRQAQRIRGHRFRGLRDLLPLVIPLLANSLERSIQLAETMEARGFGSAVSLPSRRRALLSQLGLLAALVGVLVGLSLLAFYPQARVWAWLLVAIGVIGMLAFFAFHGRQVKRTRYRRQSWHAPDTVVAVASAISLAIVIVVRLTAPDTFFYSPYPPNSLLPAFDPLVGVALLLLVMPVLVAPRGAAREASNSEPAARDMEHVA